MEQPVGSVFIDLLFLLLCVRILYISVSRGVVYEIIKIVGLLIGAFFAFQYYSFLGDTVGKSILFLNKKYFHLVTFLVILLGVRAIFSFLGLIVRLLFKREDIASLERWIAFFAGSFRASLIFSIILFVIHLSPFDSKSLTQSKAQALFRNIAPGSYLLLQRSLAAFNPKFTLNRNVEEYLNYPKSG